MKEYRFNIRQFANHFQKVYSLLYELRAVPGYNEAVAEFDRLADENPEMLSALAIHRGDFISSDREAAAFVFTFYGMIKKEMAAPA